MTVLNLQACSFSSNMAAYFDRALTLMSGDGPSINNLSLLESPNTSLYGSSTPLQVFCMAKQRINDIFREISSLLGDTIEIFLEVNTESSLINKELETVRLFSHQVNKIREIITRDKMKVAFFGRTSNGKSTVINALLGDKILPSGIGHTTSCFLQVEGSDLEQAYLTVESSNEKQNVDSLAHLAHALCKDKLDESELVRIFWPKLKCLLLQNDVIFLDSPGTDITENLDGWIERYCLDADVFVLVANAESTIMVTEKNFFHKVASRISRPNIFILNNRWDASTSEPDLVEQVREQHFHRAMHFLVNEIKSCTKQNVHHRIFFTCAKEVLRLRMLERKGEVCNLDELAKGYAERLKEFEYFESKMEECLSSSAIKTKFFHRCEQGKEICSKLEKILVDLHDKSIQLKSKVLLTKQELEENLSFAKEESRVVINELQEETNRSVSKIEKKVSKVIDEELNYLCDLVSDFNFPFLLPENGFDEYKRQLLGFVGRGLEDSFRSRLCSVLELDLENSRIEMTQKVCPLLSDERKQISMDMLRQRQPFELNCIVNSQTVCADFQEDLEFRFSWGVSSLMNRISCVNPIATNDINGVVGTDVTGILSTVFQVPGGISLFNNIYESQLCSRSTLIGIFLAGSTLKTVGWRLVLMSVAMYGWVYFYEKMAWGNKSKERALKTQFIAHMKKKLNAARGIVSADCGEQVQHELTNKLSSLSLLVEETMNDRSCQLGELDRELAILSERAKTAKLLSSRSSKIVEQMKEFEAIYIKCNNPYAEQI